MTGFLAGATTGFGCFFRGLGLLFRTPRLWPYAVTPFLIGLGLLIWGGVWAWSNLSGVVAGVLPAVTSSSSWFLRAMWWGAMLLVWPTYLLALFFATFLASRLIASPFHALLAERTLIELKVIADHPFRLGTWIRLSLRMLRVSVIKSIVFAFVGFGLFIISLIPVLNVIGAAGFVLIVAFDSADYSFEALQMGFRDRLRYFRAQFPYFCGFAISLGLVFLIPGFNFFLFPAAVVGGSDLVSRTQPSLKR